MRYIVEERLPGWYMIVPEGREPLPALFRSRDKAQLIAEMLAASEQAQRPEHPLHASDRQRAGDMSPAAAV